MTDTRDPKKVVELAKELTKRLSDQGKIIAGGWAGYEMLMDPDAGATQRAETRMAFYGGAHHLFQSIMVIMDADREPTPDDMRRMDLIAAELDAFMADYKKRHNIE